MFGKDTTAMKNGVMSKLLAPASKAKALLGHKSARKAAKEFYRRITAEPDATSTDKVVRWQASFLDPFSTPEPFQETGLGASLVRQTANADVSGEHTIDALASRAWLPSCTHDASDWAALDHALSMAGAERGRGGPLPEKATMPPYTDAIDALDTIGPRYHHPGPYDAALPSRNADATTSPLAAVHDSNMEALRATPRENVIDALSRHVPLQGVASIPPGQTDPSGRVMDYVEGADLMREADSPGGAYKRWPGLNYHPDDLKGKGEPEFTIGKQHHGRASHRLSVPVLGKGEKHRRSSHRLSVPVQSKEEKHRHNNHRLSFSVQADRKDEKHRHLSLPVQSKDAHPQASLRRSLSTGKARLMRRLSSVRHRKSDEDAAV
ncbi:hypothetical protein CDD80_6058 [Ophiocordyceps camponoti-rufipedis]|uniref:Uncharacterized protein n=1 Tax=Ophiocordyceps camponoti-rufipedis TaxID=2004952 RepID=A0A2C5XWX4_9HYPO|nr:hypothetical protein CDD80_6058 [Ophiocordyceps camponoti-rufipedis]